MKDAMANAYRGEVILILSGERFLLRPTFAALSGLEAEAGESFLAIAERFADRKASLKDLTRLLAAGILGGGGMVPADLGEKVIASGLAETQETLARFVLAACGIVPEAAAKDEDRS